MSFSAPKASGWSFGEVLTSTQMNSINDDLPNAVDGDAGGTYTPTAPIIVAGDGGGAGHGLSVANANVTGNLTGDLDITGNATVSGSVTWSGITALPKVGTRTYTYVQPLTLVFTNTIPTSWASGTTSSNLSRVSIDNTARTSRVNAWFECPNLPTRGVITGVTAYILPAVERSNLPSSLPNVAASDMVIATGVYSNLGTQEDTSANLAAFEAYHAIQLTGLSFAIDGTRRFGVTIGSDADADAGDVGTIFIEALTVDVQVTEVAP